MNPEYARALAAANKELDALMTQKITIDARISRLKATIETLSALTDKRAEEDIRAMNTAFAEGMGLTKAVKVVLYEATGPMKAPDIRNAMRAKGYDMSQYRSELTVIHNTIKRLMAQDEIEVRHDKYGSFAGWCLKDLRNTRTGQPGDANNKYTDPSEITEPIGRFGKVLPEHAMRKKR